MVAGTVFTPSFEYLAVYVILKKFPHGVVPSVLQKPSLHMGFGGGRGAAPAGLNGGGHVRSLWASRDYFLTTSLWTAQLAQ